ncbi:hypothetical protein [Streptomyces violaceorubidus]|uniref:Uncharacterized protein n=1 Tax=Streptomyces violaceorubidus TaxID=284042 RepID=A0ABV1T0Y8_9ACTN
MPLTDERTSYRAHGRRNSGLRMAVGRQLWSAAEELTGVRYL